MGLRFTGILFKGKAIQKDRKEVGNTQPSVQHTHFHNLVASLTISRSGAAIIVAHMNLRKVLVKQFPQSMKLLMLVHRFDSWRDLTFPHDEQ
jgi:hypothetical protein